MHPVSRPFRTRPQISPRIPPTSTSCLPPSLRIIHSAHPYLSPRAPIFCRITPNVPPAPPRLTLAFLLLSPLSLLPHNHHLSKPLPIPPQRSYSCPLRKSPHFASASRSITPSRVISPFSALYSPPPFPLSHFPTIRLPHPPPPNILLSPPPSPHSTPSSRTTHPSSRHHPLSSPLSPQRTHLTSSNLYPAHL
jgi:hypothetical protein